MVGGPAWACAAPRLGPNPASGCSDSATSWGPPPCSSIRKGVPLYGWKNWEIFAVVGTGRTGLRVCRHVGLLLAHRPHVSEPLGGRGPLIAAGRCPAGVQGRRGHSLGQTGSRRPELSPGRARGLAAEAPIASPDFHLEAWSSSPGPRFTAGECPLRTSRTGVRRCLHREGGSSSGGLRSRRSHSLLGWFSTDKRVEDPASKSAAWGQGGGVSAKAWLSAAQAGLRADSPRENGSAGVGHARLGPLHRSRNRGWHPVQAPGPSFFPGTLPLRGWERCW